jgi:hypothetical protein
VALVIDENIFDKGQSSHTNFGVGISGSGREAVMNMLRDKEGSWLALPRNFSTNADILMEDLSHPP